MSDTICILCKHFRIWPAEGTCTLQALLTDTKRKRKPRRKRKRPPSTYVLQVFNSHHTNSDTQTSLDRESVSAHLGVILHSKVASAAVPTLEHIMVGQLEYHKPYVLTRLRTPFYYILFDRNL